MSSFLGDLILGMPLHGVPVVALDVETTGLSAANGDKVVEVALIRCRQGGITEATFKSFVNPEREIGARATEVHGITAADVDDAPRFAEVLPWVSRMLEGGVLVAHNAAFDLGFLRAEYEAAGAELPECHVVCTLNLARRWLGMKRNKLEDLRDRYGLGSGVINSHRAMDDARTCLEAFEEMCYEMGVKTWGEVLE